MATSIREWLPRKETPTITRERLRGKETPAQHRASPNILSPSRPIGTKSAVSTTEKSISNHVRRMRGRLNVDQPIMKCAATKKPVASFNKPWFPRSYDHNSPNTSQSIKARQSPNLKEKGMRISSSFSGPRSSGKTLQKATSSRIGKTTAKDVEKKQSSSARHVGLKKSNNVKNKKNSRDFAASSRTPPTTISSSERAEGPQTVNVPHPQEDDPQPSVIDEDILINGLSSDVNDEQVPINALRSHEMPADVAQEKEQRQTKAPMQAESYIHEKKDIKINKKAHVQAEPYIHEKKDIKIIKTPTSEVVNKDATNSSEEEKHQNVPSKGTSNFDLESQLLQEQLEVDNTNSINKKVVVQAEDQGKEKVKAASKGSMKANEAEHHNVQGKETNIVHHECKVLQEQFQVDSTDSINKNIEEQAKGQGREVVKDVYKGSMKTEEAEHHNEPGRETSRFHLEAPQLQEQPKAKNTDPLNENLEVQAKDQGKVEVKDGLSIPGKHVNTIEGKNEENQAVNLRETEEVKTIASPEPQSKEGPRPTPSPVLAPENTLAVVGKRTNPVQGKKEENQIVNLRKTEYGKNSASPEPKPKSTPEPAPTLSSPHAPENTLTVVANRANLVEGKNEETQVVNLREIDVKNIAPPEPKTQQKQDPGPASSPARARKDTLTVGKRLNEIQGKKEQNRVVNLRETEEMKNIASPQPKPHLGPTLSPARAPEETLTVAGNPVKVKKEENQVLNLRETEVKNIASSEPKSQSKPYVGPAPSTRRAPEDILVVAEKRTNPVPEKKEEKQVDNLRESVVKNVSSEQKPLSKTDVGPSPSPTRAPKDIQANPLHEKKEENQVVNSRETEEVKNIASPEQNLQSEPDPRPTPSPIPGPENIHKVAGKRNPVQQEKKEENQVVNSIETKEVKNIASQKQKPHSKPDPRPALSPIRAHVNTLTITGKHTNPVHKKKEENQVVNSRQSKEVKNNASLEQKTQPKPDPRPTPSPARAPENTLTIAGKQANLVHEKKEENQVVNSRQPEEVKNNAFPEHKPQSKRDVGPTPSLAPTHENTLRVTEKRSNPVQGKNELTSMSNDVIEETANKLQAQRKNKVAALAAAFETVISRQ